MVSLLHQSVSLETELLVQAAPEISCNDIGVGISIDFHSSNHMPRALGTKKSLTHTVAYLGHNSCNPAENPISFSNGFKRYEATLMIYSKYYFYTGQNSTNFTDILNSWDNLLTVDCQYSRTKTKGCFPRSPQVGIGRTSAFRGCAQTTSLVKKSKRQIFVLESPMAFLPRYLGGQIQKWTEARRSKGNHS